MGNNTQHKKITKSKSLERVSEEKISWSSKRLLNEHILRYVFAKKYIKNKVVLDIACGIGYGTNMLSRFGARFVYGIDNDKNSIIKAKNKYINSRIKFLLGDAHEINLKSKSIDVVISFETIEHLKEPDIFLKEVKRILKPDGLLILSTPNRLMSYEDNPYHIKEYTLEELKIMVSDFQILEYFGQRHVYKKIVRIYKFIYIHIEKILLFNKIRFFLRFRPWENQKIHKLNSLNEIAYMYIILICKKK